MMLNQLISRYLDGDLSAEQDGELRRTLSADPNAKSSFDAAVLLHIAMRCEDGIDVPRYTHDGVRDLIHTRIEADNAAREIPLEGPGIVTSTTRGPSNRVARSMALTIAVLVAAWVPFHDSYHVQSRLPDVQQQERSGIERVINAASHVVTGRERASNTVAAQQLEQSETIELAVAPTNPDASSATYATLNAHMNAPVGYEFASPRASQSERSVALSVSEEATSIILSSFYGQGVASAGKADGGVTQVAQSIGYSISSRSHIGIEFGAMVYDVQMSYVGASGEVASANSSAIDHAPPGERELNKLPVAVTPGKHLQREEFSSVVRANALWGAAFYQQDILRSNILSLRGRIGAGAGQDGPLTYLRLQAETRITSGIFLSVGTEGRIAPFRTGAVSGSSTSATYGGMISLLYGVRIDL